MSFNVNTDEKFTCKSVAKRFEVFKNNMGDPATQPMKVYNPLSPKMIEELILIRDVSSYLQKKKDDEQAKVEQVEVAVAEAEVKQDETSEIQEDTQEEKSAE